MWRVVALAMLVADIASLSLVLAFKSKLVVVFSLRAHEWALLKNFFYLIVPVSWIHPGI